MVHICPECHVQQNSTTPRWYLENILADADCSGQKSSPCSQPAHDRRAIVKSRVSSNNLGLVHQTPKNLLPIPTPTFATIIWSRHWCMLRKLILFPAVLYISIFNGHMVQGFVQRYMSSMKLRRRNRDGIGILSTNPVPITLIYS